MLPEWSNENEINSINEPKVQIKSKQVFFFFLFLNSMALINLIISLFVYHYIFNILYLCITVACTIIIWFNLKKIAQEQELNNIN
jgi:hypothetical protein